MNKADALEYLIVLFVDAMGIDDDVVREMTKCGCDKCLITLSMYRVAMAATNGGAILSPSGGRVN